MTNKFFENVRKTELKSVNSNFNFDEILYKTVNNSYWQDKKALWTVISGACIGDIIGFRHPAFGAITTG